MAVHTVGSIQQLDVEMVFAEALRANFSDEQLIDIVKVSSGGKGFANIRMKVCVGNMHSATSG